MEQTLSDPAATRSHFISTQRKAHGTTNRGNGRLTRTPEFIFFLGAIENLCTGRHRGLVGRLEAGHCSCGGNPPKQKHVCLLLLHWALPCQAPPPPVGPTPCHRASSQNQGLSAVRYPPSAAGGGGVTVGLRGTLPTTLQFGSNKEHSVWFAMSLSDSVSSPVKLWERTAEGDKVTTRTTVSTAHWTDSRAPVQCVTV